jgi:hypothetical protein
MMRRASGMVAVEFGVNTRMAHPLQYRQKSRAPEDRLQRADVPAHEEDLEFGIAFDQPVDELPDRLGFAGQPHLGHQADTRVEIPPDQHDPFARQEHRAVGVTEIIVGIDDHAHAWRQRAPPDAGF